MSTNYVTGTGISDFRSSQFQKQEERGVTEKETLLIDALRINVW